MVAPLATRTAARSVMMAIPDVAQVTVTSCAPLDQYHTRARDCSAQCGGTASLVATLHAHATLHVSWFVQVCLEDGCSLDTVDDLLAELKAASQTSSGQERASALETYSQLKVLAAKYAENAGLDKSELEKVVAGIARNFGTVDAFEFKGPAVGYSSKPGTTTTAFKAD